MSTCTRCGASFSCGMADGAGAGEACWCMRLPPLLPVSRSAAANAAPAAGCWCPACLEQHAVQAARDAQRRV